LKRDQLPYLLGLLGNFLAFISNQNCFYWIQFGINELLNFQTFSVLLVLLNVFALAEVNF